MASAQAMPAHVHQWERWTSSLMCECPLCAGVERRVECADCDAVVHEKDSVPSDFAPLWQSADQI